MILKYTDPQGVLHEWDLQEAKFLRSEAEAVEKIAEIRWAERNLKVRRKDIGTMHALVWVLLKRKQPNLRYSACDLEVDAVVEQYSAWDIRDMWEDIGEQVDWSEAEREDGYRQLAVIAAKYGLAEVIEELEAEDPKAEPAAAPPRKASKASGSNTAGSSPTT